MKKLECIDLIVLDVDGTLTDGKIYIDNNGNEMKAFNAKDGMAIAQAIKEGVYVSIITGRESNIVTKRAMELGIKYVIQGSHNKKEDLKKILNNLNIDKSNVLYIGDDINDLQVMRYVGFSACPVDSANEVIRICDIISRFKGGEGAVREIVEKVLKSKKIWEKISLSYEGVNQ